MFDTAELASMRTTINATLPETVTISRPTRVSDGAGGATTTWVATSTTTARVSPADTQSTETPVGDKVGTRQRWQFTFPAGTDVTANDRIVWGTRTFEIVGADTTRSYELSVRAAALEVL